MNRTGRLSAAIVAVLMLVCQPGCRGTPGSPLKVTSTAFADGERIPIVYTCDGQNFSPPLNWSEAPGGTRSLAVIMDDPDAGGWVHWIVFNLYARTKALSAGAAGGTASPGGGVRGQGSGGLDYVGPCPPPQDGPHRYSFRVYALDNWINLPEGVTREQLLDAMEGHILAQGELTGTYSRQAEGGEGK